MSLNKAGAARGDAYVDDGESYPPGPSRKLHFVASDCELKIESKGEYCITQKLETITVLGVPQQPTTVSLNCEPIDEWTYDAANEELVLSNLCIELDTAETKVSWQ